MISANESIDKNDDDNYIYEIYDDAYNRCVTTATRHKFVFAIRRFKCYRNIDVKYKVVLICFCNTIYKKNLNKKRNRNINDTKIVCFFLIHLFRNKNIEH